MSAAPLTMTPDFGDDTNSFPEGAGRYTCDTGTDRHVAAGRGHLHIAEIERHDDGLHVLQYAATCVDPLILKAGP